jgi:hypothetical protein
MRDFILWLDLRTRKRIHNLAHDYAIDQESQFQEETFGNGCGLCRNPGSNPSSIKTKGDSRIASKQWWLWGSKTTVGGISRKHSVIGNYWRRTKGILIAPLVLSASQFPLETFVRCAEWELGLRPKISRRGWQVELGSSRSRKRYWFFAVLLRGTQAS